ncbi:phosphonatase-like hydrolase [Frondihabitans australicus]|uniref:Phosphonatase-like hydrolase n=1 Tax=Frondihabitans australicus TaxID=386892 RepID=A0A495II41_9MICO|nr:phosphonatase-like hydrolase [Frondihabitans australicus]RKR75439.1 phosphonatase-like hydrolase [Frondihabitans australicus]
MIDLAVFDMAGTTIDDGGVVYRALEAAVTGAGATVDPTDLQTWMGTDKVSAITALLPLGGVDATPSLVDDCFDTFKAYLAQAYVDTPPTPFAGVEEAIATLRSRGIKVALTTGFDREVTSGLLTSLGWGVDAGARVVLDAVVTTSDVVAGRPAPYMIHHAMELTGVVSVAGVLAAGDTIVDLQAARNAGAIAVGVLTGALPEAALAEGPHDYILPGVAVIPTLSECAPAAAAV